MKKLLIAIAVLCLLSLIPSGHAQTAAMLAPQPKFQPLDNNGKPVSGGKLCTYQAGTTTPLASYSDSSGLSLNTNPVILDSAGRADFWLGSSGYKVQFRQPGTDTSCSTGAVIWTVDNVNAANLSAISSLVSATCTSPGPATVGFIKLCNGDVFNWRNQSNTANIGWSQGGAAATANGNLADVLRYGSANTGGLQANRFIDFSAAPAQSGVYGTGNNVCAVAARNAAGNADVCGLQVNGSNVTNLGGAAGIAINGSVAVTGISGTGANLASTVNPVFAGAFDLTASTGLPAATNANLWMAGGFGSPVLGKIYVGDGSGWELDLAKRTGSTDTSLFKFLDSGNFTQVQGTAALAKVTVGTGITNSGAGMMHVRATSCTTAASLNALCSTTITWPGTWADTNYTVNCSIFVSVGSAFVTRFSGTTTTQVTVEIENSGGSSTATTGTLNCTGIHD